MVNQKKFQEFISMCQWMVQEGLPVVIFATIFKHFYFLLDWYLFMTCVNPRRVDMG